MLACNEAVTLVRHIKTASGDRYETEVIHGVSWFSKIGMNPANSGESPAEHHIVRIPAAVVPEVLPHRGDTMVRGELTVEVTRLRDIPERMDSFLITRIGDNRRGRLSHVVVSNE